MAAASGSGSARRADRPSRADQARLHEEVHKAVTTPAVRDRLIGLGVTPLGNGPAEFKPYIAEQVKLFAETVRTAGIEPQ